MTYTLLLWILGCVGPACEIPDFEAHAYPTLAECESALEVWQKISKRHVGVCVEGEAPKHVEIWQVEK